MPNFTFLPLTKHGNMIKLYCDDGNGNQTKTIIYTPKSSTPTPCRRRKLQDLGVLSGGFMLKGSIITNICPICGKPFHVKPSHVKSTTCCSRACRGKRQSEMRSGDKSSKWKGGKYKSADGYIQIFMPNHPYTHSGGYVNQSRLVMENILGRILTPEEIVHHKNKVRDDNRPENLEVMSNSQHMKHHQSNVSDKIRELRRIASTGRVQSPETREKHRIAMLGKKKTPEHVANMVKARWGREWPR